MPSLRRAGGKGLAGKSRHLLVPDVRKKRAPTSSSGRQRALAAAWEALWYLTRLQRRDADPAWLNEGISDREKAAEIRALKRETRKSPLERIQETFVAPSLNFRVSGVAGRGWSGVVLLGEEAPRTHVLKVSFERRSDLFAEVALQREAEGFGVAPGVVAIGVAPLEPPAEGGAGRRRTTFNLLLEAVSGTLQELLCEVHPLSEGGVRGLRLTVDGAALGHDLVRLLGSLHGHKRWISHGDLHLGNVAYVVDEGDPARYSLKLIDFGWAARHEKGSSAQAGAIQDVERLLEELEGVRYRSVAGKIFAEETQRPLRGYLGLLQGDAGRGC